MSQKILIVDDSSLIHQMYESELKEAGFEVIHANDGMEAISQTFTEMPDLIVLDINMPKINGYQVCRLLKDHPATRHIPIIIQTSPESFSAVSDPKQWSFETGADAYMNKEDKASIVEAVTSCFKKKPPSSTPHEKQRPLTEMEVLSALSKLLDRQLYKDVTRLKELDERKNSFVANVSHEFRSPLTIIQGYLQLMNDELCGPLTPQQKKSIEGSLKTVQRLSRLVTDLLDLSKIEAGKMELKKEKVDLISLLEEVIGTYQVSADKKKIQLKKEVPKKIAPILGDRDRLMQVIINLLSNSIKFVQEGGVVVLRLIDEKENIRFEVEDNGPGMNSKDLEKVFDKFERLTAEKKEGTGLGLPISKDIVKLHGGRILVESTEGKGSKFIVVLPKG